MQCRFGESSGVDCFLSMCEALGSKPGISKGEGRCVCVGGEGGEAASVHLLCSSDHHVITTVISGFVLHNTDNRQML